ncbi:MAG TPA: FtsX-like permease family protein, partial [Bryobacteraceae bacterium]|nr:FtsX-like permease family protein [Bryobacteraceae bacterium]
VYMPFYQDETAHVYRSMRLFVRGVPEAAGIAGTVRAGLRTIEPNLPVNVQTMSEVLSQSISSRRFTLLLLSSFATLATLLAGFGIYGVVTYSVTRRTREIGLRMALGASRGRVLRMVLREVLIPVIGGSALGGFAAIAASGWMNNLLYRTPPADPLVLSATVAIMLAVALAAAALPAQRAASTDPQTALRAE